MNSRAPQLTDLLDEAIHLLRGAPGEVWLIYLIGALPFATAFVAVAQQLTMARSTSNSFIAASLLLAALYLWMSACRLRFAQRLLRFLEASAGDDASSVGAGPTLTISQLSLSVAELVVFPLAALAIVPLPWTVAFFRSTAYVPAQHSGRLRSLIRSTAQRASLWQAQNWLILLFILAFAFVALVNLGVMLLLLPSLYRMFSGYENEFTRNSMATMFAPIFIVACTLTWICIEPLVLAVYALRSFYADAWVSGRDLLVALARIATCFLIVSGVALFVTPTQAASSESLQLEREIHDVLRQPRYSWRADLDRPVQQAAKSRFPLLQAIVDGVNSSLKTIGKWMRDLGAYLDKLLRNNEATSPKDKDQPPNRSVLTLVYVLIGCVAVVLVVFLVIRLRRQRSDASLVPSAAAPVTVDLTDENLLASDLPEDEWLALSRKYLDDGNGRFAVRSMYLANLAWLARHSLLSVSAFKSNREYQRELARRAHSPDIANGFARNLSRFERTWYGRYEPDAELIAGFQDDLRVMKGFLDA